METPGELDYHEALDWYGLRFRQAEPPKEDKAKDGTTKDASVKESAPKKAWIGMDTRVDNGRLIVSRVPRSTPAFDAGLNVDDEILAIGDYRVRADLLAARLDSYRPGDHVSVLVARRDRLTRLDLTFGEEPAKWQLELKPDASSAQKHHLDAWLGRT